MSAKTHSITEKSYVKHMNLLNMLSFSVLLSAIVYCLPPFWAPVTAKAFLYIYIYIIRPYIMIHY